jgi:hypothetical protein
MMDIGKCLENLKADLSNGGVVEDTFAAICYVTMANTACRILAEGATQKEFNKAREYIALCNTSGVGSLMSVTGV